jgi:uncharacterized protein
MLSPLPRASAGLGLRRALLGALQDAPAGAVDFLECAPENWIAVGGTLGAAFDALSRRHPVTCHGLSLSLGGPGPLDDAFVARVDAFLERHHVAHYSEHLSYCSDDGQLYDLLPIPFTDAAVALAFLSAPHDPSAALWSAPHEPSATPEAATM